MIFAMFKHGTFRLPSVRMADRAAVSSLGLALLSLGLLRLRLAR
jgi:hypothetical protein